MEMMPQAEEEEERERCPLEETEAEVKATEGRVKDEDLVPQVPQGACMDCGREKSVIWRSYRGSGNYCNKCYLAKTGAVQKPCYSVSPAAGQQGPSAVGAVAVKTEPAELALTAEDADLVPKLEKGTEVVVNGLVGATEFNGMTGVCQYFTQLTGRWHVLLATGIEKDIQPGNLTASSQAASSPVVIDSDE